MALTDRRDLRTGRTVWQARRLPPLGGTTLGRSTRADALVIGAGISGALVAEQLTAAGLDVVIVDRRRAISGSTAASTALLQYDIDTPLTHLSRRIGAARAQGIWRRSRLAVDALRERTRHLGVDADMSLRDSLYLDGNLLSRRALAREGEARRLTGLESVYLTPGEVEARYGIAGRAGLLGFGNVSADPRRLAAGFLQVAIARGARLHETVEVATVTPGRHRVRATTVDGAVITCRWVVFATGYELARGVPRRGHRIVSTWAMATTQQPGALWPSECFIWEASDPYLYLRTTPDGRIVCGGEDESLDDATRRDAQIAAKVRVLERKLSRLFPDCNPQASYAWAGSFGSSPTGTPSIGRVPRMPGCYAVLGFGGNGITFSALAAQVIAADIAGRRDADAGLFAFTRGW